jgi:hypothetical protein
MNPSPYINTDCTGLEDIVPKIYHSVGRNSKESFHQMGTTATNPSYVRQHRGDLEACGIFSANAGLRGCGHCSCFAPPASRADVFRFCALYADGGIYLDSDMAPLYRSKTSTLPVPSPPLAMTFLKQGGDPQGGEKLGKPTKILAGAPGEPIFKCMLDRIIETTLATVRIQKILSH